MDKSASVESAVVGQVAGSPQFSDVAIPGLVGLGIGGGARLVKHIIDVARGKDLPPTLPKVPRSTAGIPVNVSPSEAQELEAGGMPVKHAADNGFLGGLVQGMTVVPAAYAGWSGMDSLFQAHRKAMAAKKLQGAQQRLQGLLAGSPSPEDAPLGKAMKMAEEAYVKTAFGGYYLGAPLGVSAAMLGVSAFNQARQQDKYKKSVHAIRQYLLGQQEKPSEIQLEPVVHDREPAPTTATPDLQALGQKVARALRK